MKNRLQAHAAFPAFLMHASAEGDPPGGGGGSPPPPPPASPPAAPPPPPPPASASPFDGLSDENKAYHEKKQYKGVDDVFTALRNAESFVGLDKAQLLKLPADRSPDKMGEVFEALGKPKDIAGYEIKPNAEIGLDGPALESFLKVGNEEAHLTKHQAKVLIEKWYEPMVKQFGEKQTADLTASYEAGDAAIRTEFGDAYDDTVKSINALFEEHGDGALDDYLLKSGRGNDPAFAKFMAKIAKLVAEPGKLPGETGRDLSGAKMTPSEATARLSEFERVNGAALLTKSHPDHKALVQQREELIKAANPRP